MPRQFDQSAFSAAFDKLIVRGRFNEEPSYYPRYRSRYQQLMELFAKLAPASPCKVLDIGGGQFAVLTHALWHDDCMAADIGGEHLNYVASLGNRTARWNLCSDDQPFQNEFDVV